MKRHAPLGKQDPAQGAPAIYPISLCMIVRNEEDFLRDALTSVQGVVDEVCIADTGSTDGTVAIAESFGAKMCSIEWRDDFGWARNQALALATGAWIFVLDADERLAPESRELLRALRNVKPDGRGRWIRCRNYGDSGHDIVSSTNAIVRIFPNDPEIRYRGTLHEYVGRVGSERSMDADRTPIEIVHYGYTHAVMSARSKADRNFRVSQAAYEAAPEDPAAVYNYAMSAMLAGHVDIARTQLQNVIAMTAGTPRGFRPMALVKLAGIHIGDGLHVAALEVAEECIGIVPTFPDGHYVLGQALTGLGRYVAAREALEAAIALGSKAKFEHFVVDDEIPIWKAHNEIAATFVREKRFAEAVEWLDRALAARPHDRTLTRNRARCLESLGDMPGAAAAFRRLFDASLDETTSIEYVNFVLRTGSPDDVVAAVELTLPVLNEDYEQAFLTSAAAFMLRAGRTDEARGLLRRVLDAAGGAAKGWAMIATLAERYGAPELNALLEGDARHAFVRGGGS